MTVALCGAHRVGKSTLAREYAKKHGWKFAETSVSAIFRELGHDPAESFDFRTRLTIQEQILIRLNKFYRDTQGNSVITDRSPIDMLAYTMAEAIGEAVSPADQKRFKAYANSCFEVTNKWFSSILVVQPGITLVYEEGKAALNEAYIEHLNSLIIGLCNDERLNVPHFYIPRSRTDMQERIKSVDVANQRGLERAMLQASQMESRSFH